MQRSEPSRGRILVVEDEKMVLELIITRLEIEGYKTFSARDGYEGLARLDEVRPTAMLLDVNMPRLDGFSVLKLMKERGLLAKTPTMVLTARNQPNDVATAIGLGAKDFLTKPFRDDQLLARVARLVRRPPSSRVTPPSGALLL